MAYPKLHRLLRHPLIVTVTPALIILLGPIAWNVISKPDYGLTATVDYNHFALPSNLTDHMKYNREFWIGGLDTTFTQTRTLLEGSVSNGREKQITQVKLRIKGARWYQLDRFDGSTEEGPIVDVIELHTLDPGESVTCRIWCTQAHERSNILLSHKDGVGEVYVESNHESIPWLVIFLSFVMGGLLFMLVSSLLWAYEVLKRTRTNTPSS